jgi:hypothetical protein
MTDCTICYTNKSNINCLKCNLEACKSCIKIYLMTDKDINPKCMSCKSIWDFDFIREKFGSDFDDKYRKYRSSIILEREKSLLPQTQSEIVEKKNKEELKNSIIQEIKRINSIIDKTLDKDFIEKQKKIIKKQMKLLKSIDNDNDNKNEEFKEAKNTYFGHCPQNDCRGYLDEIGLCGICNKKACQNCRQIEHKDECNKDVIKNLELLRKETKNCPNCRIPISKISGCDQMYCVKCHTAFSWQTGEIEKGRIHNPHYYEYMRNNGILRREEGDNPCGGNRFFEEFSQFCRDNYNIMPYTYINNISNIHRQVGDIRDKIQREYKFQTGTIDNKDLREKFLTNTNFTEKKWISEIAKKEKAREKRNTINNILSMYTNVVDDLLNNMMTNIKNSKPLYQNCLDNLGIETEKIIDFIILCRDKVKIYHSDIKIIRENILDLESELKKDLITVSKCWSNKNKDIMKKIIDRITTYLHLLKERFINNLLYRSNIDIENFEKTINNLISSLENFKNCCFDRQIDKQTQKYYEDEIVNTIIQINAIKDHTNCELIKTSEQLKNKIKTINDNYALSDKKDDTDEKKIERKYQKRKPTPYQNFKKENYYKYREMFLSYNVSKICKLLKSEWEKLSSEEQNKYKSK